MKSKQPNQNIAPQTQGTSHVSSSAVLGCRWKLADILSLIACKLRGHKWYLAAVWHGVPGNRAAELRERIWQNAVLLTPAREYKSDRMAELEADLNELAQLAGENWGHINVKQPNVPELSHA